MTTVFSKIITREIPAHIVYEDDDVIAFLDIAQLTKGHTLVVPKTPLPDIYSLNDELGAKLMIATMKVSKAIQKAFNPDGLNVINNNGEAAKQTVFHFHFHVIPRYLDDDFKISYRNNMDKMTKDEYEHRANLIKAALL